MKVMKMVMMNSGKILGEILTRLRERERERESKSKEKVKVKA